VALPKNLEHGFMHELHRYTNKQTNTHTHTKAHKSYGDFFPKFGNHFSFSKWKKGKRFGKFLKVVSSFWKKKKRERKKNVQYP
jgi:hypothetical protein